MFSVISDDAADFPGLDIPKAKFKLFVDDEEVDPDTPICQFIGKKKLTTAQVPPSVFLRMIKQAEVPVLIVTISSKLSGTYNSAKIAARMSGKEVYVFDSAGISLTEGMVAKKAVELAEKGYDIKEAVEELEKYRKRVKLYAAVKNLSSLAKSGRVPNVIAAVGNLLKISVILEVKEWEINTYRKKFGFDSAIENLKKEFGKKAVVVGNICAEEKAKELAESLNLPMVNMCNILAAHTGEVVAVGVEE